MSHAAPNTNTNEGGTGAPQAADSDNDQRSTVEARLQKLVNLDTAEVIYRHSPDAKEISEQAGSRWQWIHTDPQL